MRRLIIALLLLSACEPRPIPPPPSREAVGYVEVAEPPHRVSQSLPPWAACWFPHEAYPGALRRAQPCPPETRATRSYTRRELAGCWEIRFGDGRPFDGPEPYDGPVRLLVHPTAAMRRDGFGKDDGAVVAAGRTPLHDRHGFAEFWLFAPPDSVQMYAAAIYLGTRFDFRVRGDSMVGMVRGFTDVIASTLDTTSIAVDRVTAHRIRCP